MADNVVPNADLEASLQEGGIPPVGDTSTGAYEPVYRVIGDNKIPVSKATGKMWKSRRDTAKQARSEAEECWHEAIRYYNNDQMQHRQSDQHGAGNKATAKRLNDFWAETENSVFANTCAMLPILYAKNPAPSITATSSGNEELASLYQHLLTTLSNMRDAPGINLKPKARRGVLTALLTNRAWLKVGWTPKADSSEEAMKTLMQLAERLEKAADIKEIEEVEGQIIALEKQINILTPEGPFAKIISPFNLLVDPEGLEPDGSDAYWMMEGDLLPTQYLKARYMKEEDKDKWVSVYEPTHVMKLGGVDGGGVDDEVANFTLSLDATKKTASMFGYEDDKVFEQAQMTKVWYVWDKTTRRVLMFHDKDWTWPIWVWNDPLGLLGFFPYTPLWFHETVDGQNPKGEVTYYLDQQDAINEINDETRRARRWVKRNVFFNKNHTNKDDVESVLKGADGTARGIDVPEGMKISDVISSIPPPSMQYKELFNPQAKYEAINRITGINDIMRGGQFKTNTTNAQSGEITNFATVRIDEKTDLIEDWLGAFYWNLLQLCVQYMQKETVVNLLGPEAGELWSNLKPEELRTRISMSVVGGSSDKPTSHIKKQEAMQMGQVLGQFVQASPAVVLVLLRVFERAFDEIVIKKEDWDFIMQTTQQNMQKAGAGPGGNQASAEGQPGVSEDDPKQQIAQLLQSLPQEEKMKIEQLVQGGMDPRAAIQRVVGGV